MHIAMQKRMVYQKLGEIRLGKCYGRGNQANYEQENKILRVRTQEAECPPVLAEQLTGEKYS